MKVKLIIRSVFVARIGFTVVEWRAIIPNHALQVLAVISMRAEFTLLVWRLLKTTSMAHLFQFTVLLCFTLIYVLIAVVLLVRLCAHLIKGGLSERDIPREEGG